MFQTEICQCGKLKQLNRVCKTCGFISSEGFAELAAEYWIGAASAEDNTVAKAMPMVGGEDDTERARR